MDGEELMLSSSAYRMMRAAPGQKTLAEVLEDGIIPKEVLIEHGEYRFDQRLTSRFESDWRLFSWRGWT